MKKEQTLNPIWESILEIYKVFASICERHNLHWCLAYGSVLGAIRHRGFIPWDDDLDIYMPRQDYDYFWEVADKELPENLKTVTIYNTKGYTQLWGKIVECRKDIVGALAERTGKKLPGGVFIDIFPLDGCYTDPLRCFLRKLKSVCAISRERWVLSNGSNSFMSRISCILGFFLAPFFKGLHTKRDFAIYNIKRLRSPLFGTTNLCAVGNMEIGDFSVSRKMPCSYFTNPERKPFEGLSIDVPVPNKWHEYLTSTYGDYMTLPPEEYRFSTHEKEPPAPWRLGPERI